MRPEVVYRVSPQKGRWSVEVQLTSTTKVVEFLVGGVRVPARIWEGVTANGIRCHAYITRIAVSRSEDTAEFEADLAEQSPPSTEVTQIPLRMIL